MKNASLQFQSRAKKALILFISLITVLSACKKSESAKDKSSLLTQGAWNLTAFEWQTADGRWVAPPSWASVPTYPPGMTLLDNGTYTSSFGAGSSSNSYGTWQLSADKSQLIMLTQKGASVTATIATLTSSNLQLSVPLPKDTYTIEGSGATRKDTYYTTERTTFSH